MIYIVHRSFNILFQCNVILLILLCRFNHLAYITRRKKKRGERKQRQLTRICVYVYRYAIARVSFACRLHTIGDSQLASLHCNRPRAIHVRFTSQRGRERRRGTLRQWNRFLGRALITKNSTALTRDRRPWRPSIVGPRFSLKRLYAIDFVTASLYRCASRSRFLFMPSFENNEIKYLRDWNTFQTFFM